LRSLFGNIVSKVIDMESVVINASQRSAQGKSASAQQRRDGMVPCILYSQGENVTFNASPTELKSLLYTPDFKIAEIKLNGTTHRCILKAIQNHPLTDKVIHLDFLKLVKGTPVKVEVPLKLKGIAAGVKSGGKMVQRMRTVMIKADSENIISEVSLDVTALELGQTLRIKDIIAIKGVEILNPGSTPVVGVEVPRALKTDAPAAATAATPTTATAPAKAEAAPAKAAAKAPAKKK
jgi:large subunit ribosomal protein L25